MVTKERIQLLSSIARVSGLLAVTSSGRWLENGMQGMRDRGVDSDGMCMLVHGGRVRSALFGAYAWGKLSITTWVCPRK